MSDSPCRLNPSTPAGFAELRVRGLLDRARRRTIAGPRDLGASVVEWVIITAIVVGLAVAVGTIIINQVNAKAKEIDFGLGPL